MTVKEIISKFNMPCNSIEELKEREEILRREQLQNRLDEIINYLDITEYAHSNGHPAYED